MQSKGEGDTRTFLGMVCLMCHFRERGEHQEVERGCAAPGIWVLGAEEANRYSGSPDVLATRRLLG